MTDRAPESSCPDPIAAHGAPPRPATPQGAPARPAAPLPRDGAVLGLAAAVAARINAVRSARGLPGAGFSPGFVRGFATLLIAGDGDSAERILLRLCSGHHSQAEIADHLLGEVARLVGERWADDTLSFVDVGLVIARLMHLRHALAAAVPLRPQAPRRGRALFATLPNQAHTLGLILAADAFRQEGWQVDLMLGARPDAILAQTRQLRPQVIGLTAGRQERLRDIVALALRLKDQPGCGRILLGGQAARRLGHGPRRIAIDAVVADIAQALHEAARPLGSPITPA
jgi:methanogenic corrinoid protein MtbC1